MKKVGAVVEPAGTIPSQTGMRIGGVTIARLAARKSVRELVAEAQVNIDADLARRTRSFAIESHDADDPTI